MRVQLRRGLAAAWAAANPVLADGEPGFEVDTDTLRIGDGATPFTSLPAIGAGGGGGDPVAQLLGLGLAVMPLAAVDAGTFALPSGTLVLSLVRAGASATLTHLGAWLRVGGVTPGANTNGLALYSEAGARLGMTGDMAAAFAGTGYVEGALGVSAPIVAGTNYYLGCLSDFTTGPHLVDATAPANIPTINGHRPAVFVAGQATFPANVNIGTATVDSSLYYLTGR
ncbi:hypothetical protein [Phytohabitans rumicis]|uniref:Major tropism determinant N-terminal domain-containing protein n=1 Tax=Phytohabitans rumicis TaxID=1076125 RepID=A0A6V8LIL8_9ACTN|nr:hypothetical protein [Phytohabitans rumicis]GFJ92485.1 hypothetical protein Prum_061270 [Phytohabitans rumicis]